MLQELISRQILGNTPADYLLAAVAIALGVLVGLTVRGLLLRSLRRTSAPEDHALQDFLGRAVRRTLSPILLVGITYFALRSLNLHPTVERVLDLLAIALETFLALRFLGAWLRYLVEARARHEDADLDQVATLRALLPAVQVLIWGLGALFVLDNLGLDLTALLAGLGIGGIAAALAAQAVLKDLFSYVAILLDRPFEVGDFIAVGDLSGSVQRIGIKTTRLESMTGEQIVVSNNDLTSSRLRNYKRMPQRNVVFKLNLDYRTPIEKLGELPQRVEKIVSRFEDVQFGRCHFRELGESALVVDVFYTIRTGAFLRYVDVQQEINLEIKKLLDEQEIRFAYPTQTVWLRGEADGP